jgi:hypothetical protein
MKSRVDMNINESTRSIKSFIHSRGIDIVGNNLPDTISSNLHRK